MIDAYDPPQPYSIDTLGPYRIPFPYAADAVRARVLLDDGTLADLTLGSDFTVSPHESDAAGDLYLAPATLALFGGTGRLVIDRATPLEQGWQGQSSREVGLQRQLDLIVMAVQEFLDIVSRSIRTMVPMPEFVPVGSDTTLIWDGVKVTSGPSVDQIAAAAAAAATVPGLADQAAQSAAEAAANAAGAAGTPSFASIAEAEIATIPASAPLIIVAGVHYVRQAGATDLVTADGRGWLRETWYRTNLIPGNRPAINISPSGIVPPTNPLFVCQRNPESSSTTAVQIQRWVQAGSGPGGGRALRVKTVMEDNAPRTEWAISGELDNHADVTALGSVAVSGVSNKYGRSGVFGGHFQSNDYNVFPSPTGVSPLVGVEMNITAVGADSPTANSGYGNRRVLDIIAKTNKKVTDWNTAPGNSGEAEIGVGIMVRTETLTGAGFRYGIVVSDSGNTGIVAKSGVHVDTSGDNGITVSGSNSVAKILLFGNGTNGIVVSGQYSGSAIRIASGQKISLEGTDAISVRFNSENNRIEFLNGSTVRGYIDMAAGVNVKMN